MTQRPKGPPSTRSYLRNSRCANSPAPAGLLTTQSSDSHDVGADAPALAHIQSGKLRPLAYTAAHRWSVLPEVPTMAEAGIQNFVMDGGWYDFSHRATLRAVVLPRLANL